jgi:adenylate cyclase
MNSFIKFIVSFVVIVGIVIGINYQYPKHFEYIDAKLVDVFFNSTEAVDVQSNVVIVDIDEKSINSVGQWPWSRNTLSKLVNQLNEFNPSCIGFGIIFSEEDRTSPSMLALSSNMKNLENYDETFALSIEDSPVPIVLGYSFLGTQMEGENYTTPYIPAVIKNNIKSNEIQMFQPSNVLLNIPIIQDSAYSSGFLNDIKDDNGKTIAMPMVMNYQDQLYPSLALEIVRTIYSARELNIENKGKGNYIEFANIKIPIDNEGSKYVNYLNTKDGFKHISAIDILNRNFNNFLLGDVQSKIVLIGSTALGLSSTSPTPFDYEISAIDLQANVIDNILSSRHKVKPVWEQEFQYIATLIAAFIVLSSIFFSAATVNVITFLIASVGTYFALKYGFDNGYILSGSYLFETILLSVITSIIFHFVKNKSDITNIKGKFASKVSKAVMDDLLDTTNRTGDLSSKRKEVTIFFSDIKSFTKITEKINDPDKLTLYINRYMDAMTKNIMLSEGTVDKFMGDAIMAYWNAPYDVQNHPDKALTSAIEQVKLLDEINVQNHKDKMPLIKIRIGLNTGPVFVGEVGGELRSDYTVMGKAVNHTAVLEQVGKFYNADIIISQSVKDNLEKEYIMLLIDIMQVDGTSDAFNIYQVFDIGTPDEFVKDEIEDFEKAIHLYRKAQFDDAILIFRNLILKEDLLNKKLCEIYIERCEINAIAVHGGEFNPVQSINKSIISGS